jgi:KipI family sensor histidine kinase inhibitor
MPHLLRRWRGHRRFAPAQPVGAKANITDHPGAALPIRSVGAQALLLELAQPFAPAAWFTELTRRRANGELDAEEIVPGATTVLLDGVADPDRTAALIRSWARTELRDGGDLLADAELVEIPVQFDGADLADVAQRWYTDAGGVAQRLCQTQLRVAFCGFSPGFAYLAGLPSSLAVPRLDTPRSRVPAGCVAIGDAYVGIYPTAGPGGWRLVGHTDLPLFDPSLERPAMLTPGVRVRLVDLASRGEAR